MRGRPKGSKNKPKTSTDTTLAAESNIKTPKLPNKKVYQKSTNHVYTELAKTSLGNPDLYNIYGIVIDATTPHFKDGKLKQHIKIIDPSIYLKANKTINERNDMNNGYVTVTFFAKTLDQLPSFSKVGDIIRIHRCNVSQFKNQKTFCVIMNYGSAWVIFDGMSQTQNDDSTAQVSDPEEPSKAKNQKSEAAIQKFMGFTSDQQITAIAENNKESDEPVIPQSYLPYKSSSKDYSLGLVDRDIVKQYRKWLSKYFKNEFQYGDTMVVFLSRVRESITQAQILGQEPKIKECDLVVRVDEIEEKEDVEEVILKVSDSSASDFEIRGRRKQVPEGLQKGELIRVSKVGHASNGKKNALDMLDQSNILLLHQSFKIYQTFTTPQTSTVHSLNNLLLGVPTPHAHNEFSHLYTSTEDVLEKPDVASSIDHCYRHLEPVDLADVLYGSSSHELFRVQFYILNIQPNNLLEACQAYCQRCVDSYSYQSVDVNCPKCLHDLEPIYHIQLLVKDKSLYQLSGAVKCLLSTLDGVGLKFFNEILPTNLYRNTQVRQVIEKHLRQIVRFNVYLDAVVERKKFEEEIILKIVSCKLKPV